MTSFGIVRLLPAVAVLLGLTGCEKPGWQVMESKDPMTDAPVADVILASTSGDSLKLVLRCIANKSDVALVSEDKISDQDDVPTTVRFDSDKPYSSQWSLFVGHKGLVIPKTDSVSGFIRRLRKSSKVAVKIVPIDGSSSLTSIFESDGLEQAMTQVSGYCDWKQYENGK